jgi:hypothetical protein
VQINPDDFRDHYASLTDEALLDLDRTELVEVAQQLYDQELARRGLVAQQYEEDSEEPEVTPRSTGARGIQTGPEPEWLEDASTAAAFTEVQGQDSARAAEEARDALENAGIPCYIELHTDDPEPVRKPQRYYRVMVPGPLGMQATSILDKEIFNADTEDRFRTHLETMSDEDLKALDPEILAAALLDRVERLRRAYRDELAHRGLDRTSA